MKTTTKRLSICPCGYYALDESIPLGTEYDIIMELQRVGHMVCGGCKDKIPVTMVYVLPRLIGDRPGYLPLKIFEPHTS